MNHLLSARSLSKRFGGVVAIDNISLVVDEREVVCIIGPNGAGKSTLLNIICGTLKPDTGALTFEGSGLSGLPEYAFARRGILRKFQVPTIFSGMSVRQNLMVAGDAVTRSYDTAELDDLLARLDLADSGTALAGTLSHGDRQRLELGMCLMCHPKLLLLDEPTAGLTTSETAAIGTMVKELAATTAIIAIEHDMAFVRQLDCRTCVMHQGRLIRDGTFSEIEADPIARAIYLARE